MTFTHTGNVCFHLGRVETLPAEPEVGIMWPATICLDCETQVLAHEFAEAEEAAEALVPGEDSRYVSEADVDFDREIWDDAVVETEVNAILDLMVGDAWRDVEPPF